MSSTSEALPTRDQAVGVMWFVEGWLSSCEPDQWTASVYLREHIEEIADYMVDSECAVEDV